MKFNLNVFISLQDEVNLVIARVPKRTGHDLCLETFRFENDTLGCEQLALF